MKVQIGRKSLLFSCLLRILFLVVLGGCSFSQKGANGLEKGTVERGDLIQSVSIPGVVFPEKSTQIAAPYAGYIKKIFVKVGDRVRVGDPVVTVTSSLLGNEPVFPMRSPLEGVVVQINKSEGEFVKEGAISGEAILRIENTGRRLIKADTPEIDRSKIREGLEAVIRINALPQKVHRGRILSVARAPTSKEMWSSSAIDYSTIIELDEPDQAVLTGMTALVDLIVEKKNQVLLLRHEFVHRDKTGYFVMTDDGERKSIEVGMQNDEAFEILSGVKEGDRVQMVNFESLVKGSM
jgi:multidrug efflux pump subunit AcrA (membrane-fusion protein)